MLLLKLQQKLIKKLCSYSGMEIDLELHLKLLERDPKKYFVNTVAIEPDRDIITPDLIEKVDLVIIPTGKNHLVNNSKFSSGTLALGFIDLYPFIISFQYFFPLSKEQVEKMYHPSSEYVSSDQHPIPEGEVKKKFEFWDHSQLFPNLEKMARRITEGIPHYELKAFYYYSKHGEKNGNIGSYRRCNRESEVYSFFDMHCTWIYYDELDINTIRNLKRTERDFFLTARY